MGSFNAKMDPRGVLWDIYDEDVALDSIYIEQLDLLRKEKTSSVSSTKSCGDNSSAYRYGTWK
jgi:hypothetical protein